MHLEPEVGPEAEDRRGNRAEEAARAAVEAGARREGSGAPRVAPHAGMRGDHVSHRGRGRAALGIHGGSPPHARSGHEPEGSGPESVPALQSLPSRLSRGREPIPRLDEGAATRVAGPNGPQVSRWRRRARAVDTPAELARPRRSAPMKFSPRNGFAGPPPSVRRTSLVWDGGGFFLRGSE